MNRLQRFYGQSGNGYEYELLTDDMSPPAVTYIIVRQGELEVLAADYHPDIRSFLSAMLPELQRRYGPVEVYIHALNNRSEAEARQETNDIVMQHNPAFLNPDHKPPSS